MTSVSSYLAIGTDNPTKQISKNDWNELLGKIGRGVPLTLQDFGAVADDTTDCLPAWDAAMTALQALANAGTNDYYKSAPRLFIPAGDYYFSGSVKVKVASLIIEGEGSFYFGPATKFRFPAGCHGFIFDHAYTTGGVYDGGAVHGAGDWSVIRNIAVVGPMSGSGNYDGIHSRVRILVDRCCTQGWARAGIAFIAAAGSGGTTEGNANCWQIIGGRHDYNKVAGIYVEGADTNAGLCLGADVSFNGQYGIYDNSFLGNTYVGCHAEYNGLGISGYVGTTNNTTSCVHKGGYLYTVMPGQAANASVNAPSGTEHSNAYWGAYNSGAATNDTPEWTNGMSLNEGGAYYAKSIVAGTVFNGCYVEGGSSPAKGFAPALFIGGSLTGGCFGTALHVVNSGGGLAAPIGKFSYVSATGTSIVQTGGVADRFTTFTAEDGSSWHWDYGAGYLTLRDGNGNQPFTISSTSGRHLVLDVSSEYRFNGTKVMGAQGAAVADATDAASAITQLNALLARLRTHGLIAT